VKRRAFLAVAGACGLSTWLPARGAPAPLPPQARCLRGRVRWLVGWSPGGGYDAYARLTEPVLERALGVEVMVDNVPGAAGRVAAATLARARPDGRTLGILDGPGTLWSALANERGAPDLVRDFTLLARLVRAQQVLVVSGRSGLRAMDDLVALSRKRRVVCGATAPGSQNFVTASTIIELLRLDADFVAGYPGSREELLALLRGDFDFLSVALDTAMDQIRAGDIVPLATVMADGVGASRLTSVPHLTGEDGLLQQRPDLFPGEPSRSRALAEAIRTYLGVGRLIAAPAGLPDEIRRCLESALRAALTAPAFEAAAARAGRAIDVAFGDDVRSGLPAARAAAGLLLPLTAAAARRLR
jgi:tripartite-type tricarboxylate transporter receptor subunit TctC